MRYLYPKILYILYKINLKCITDQNISTKIIRYLDTKKKVFMTLIKCFFETDY